MGIVLVFCIRPLLSVRDAVSGYFSVSETWYLAGPVCPRCGIRLGELPDFSVHVTLGDSGPGVLPDCGGCWSCSWSAQAGRYAPDSTMSRGVYGAVRLVCECTALYDWSVSIPCFTTVPWECTMLYDCPAECKTVLCQCTTLYDCPLRVYDTTTVLRVYDAVRLFCECTTLYDCSLILYDAIRLSCGSVRLYCECTMLYDCTKSV